MHHCWLILLFLSGAHEPAGAPSTTTFAATAFALAAATIKSTSISCTTAAVSVAASLVAACRERRRLPARLPRDGDDGASRQRRAVGR